MDGTTAGTRVEAPPPTEERISTLLADRPCARCAFNLVGQSIVRERHYGLLVVRCPECGTIASLQEYPLLGRWANRWAAIAAAAWLLLAAAVSFGIAGVMFGFTIGTMETTNRPLADLISKKHEDHQQAIQLAQGVAQPQMSGWWNIDATWWDAQDKAALLNEAGGWAGAVQWWGFLIWLVGFGILFPLGSVWAVGAAHRRGWRLLATYLPMILIAAVFFSMANISGNRWLNAGDLAARMLWPVTLPIAAALAILPLLLSAMFGRSIARCLIVLWLPPRLRVPLSFLWVCDGKTPPKPQW